MERRNKGGRPRTDRTNAVTVKLTDEAVAILNQHPRKSAFIDALIRGEVAQVKCPNYGAVITIKTED